ncbi:MAG: hypothetical protein U5Q03_12445 [Bacteroidota bacterium]|nr:hypothetical protein [Bacteroidota bacterium]
MAIGYWLLAIGYWLLAIGYWLLAIQSRLASDETRIQAEKRNHHPSILLLHHKFPLATIPSLGFYHSNINSFSPFQNIRFSFQLPGVYFLLIYLPAENIVACQFDVMVFIRVFQGKSDIDLLPGLERAFIGMVFKALRSSCSVEGTSSVSINDHAIRKVNRA